jgi:hypothetical protein
MGRAWKGERQRTVVGESPARASLVVMKDEYGERGQDGDCCPGYEDAHESRLAAVTAMSEPSAAEMIRPASTPVVTGHGVDVPGRQASGAGVRCGLP